MSGTVNWYCDHIAGTTTTLQFLNSVHFTKGRESIGDQLQCGDGSITGSRPDLLPSIQIGDRIQLKLATNPASPIKTYDFGVTDVQVTYDIVQKMDKWTITFEDAIARLGRGVLGTATTAFTWSAGATTQAVASSICTAVGLTLSVVGSYTPKFTLANRSLNQVNALDRFKQIAATEQAAVYGGFDTIFWTNIGWQTNSNLANATFTDSTITGGEMRYTTLEYTSLATGYYDSVVVKSTGVTDGTANPANKRVLVVDTDAQTATQTADLANFLVAIYNIRGARPSVIRAVVEGQPNATSRTNLYNLITGQTTPVASLVFRGATQRVVIEGFTVDANPAMTEVTFYLSSGDAYNFFRLDDDTLGIIGQNRLGLAVT